MKTYREHQKENELNVSLENQSTYINVQSQNDDDDDREELEIEERQDWGDVDPAGGDAPAAPGSAV